MTRETVEELVLNDPSLSAPYERDLHAPEAGEEKENVNSATDTQNCIYAGKLINLKTSSGIQYDYAAKCPEPAMPVMVIEQSRSKEPLVRESLLSIERVLLTPRGLAVRVVSASDLPFDQKHISLQVACAELVLGEAPLRQAGPDSVVIELSTDMAAALRQSASTREIREVTGEENGLPLLRSRFSYRLLVADSA